MTAVWPWLAIAGLGVYHGIDPSMGWLFAVALGMQEHSRAKVVAALGPIAIGHMIAIGGVVALIGWARMTAASGIVRPVGAAILIAFGLFRYLRPGAHPRWVSMRVNWHQLMLWSFLMATAHGAGLMLFPIVMDMPGSATAGGHHGLHGRLMHAAMGVGSLTVTEGILVVAVHVGTMVLVMGTIAVLVYDRFGLAFLRRAWINLDTIWAGALIAAGILSLVV